MNFPNGEHRWKILAGVRGVLSDVEQVHVSSILQMSKVSMPGSKRAVKSFYA